MYLPACVVCLRVDLANAERAILEKDLSKDAEVIRLNTAVTQLQGALKATEEAGEDIRKKNAKLLERVHQLCEDINR